MRNHYIDPLTRLVCIQSTGDWWRQHVWRSLPFSYVPHEPRQRLVCPSPPCRSPYRWKCRRRCPLVTAHINHVVPACWDVPCRLRAALAVPSIWVMLLGDGLYQNPWRHHAHNHNHELHVCGRNGLLGMYTPLLDNPRPVVKCAVGCTHFSPACVAAVFPLQTPNNTCLVCL